MKTFLFSAFLVAASVSTSLAQSPAAAAATAGWWDTLPAAASTTAPAAPEDETPRYNMGWNTAPGQSLSLHGKPTTDYWGRPLKKKAKNLTTAAAKEVAYAEEASTDPMMKSSGVMVAPGMSSSPYRKVSTDYWGRPLKKAVKSSSAVAKNADAAAPTAFSTTMGW